MMKRETLFLVVCIFSDCSTFMIAVGPFPSLQRESILSFAYSLKPQLAIFDKINRNAGTAKKLHLFVLLEPALESRELHEKYELHPVWCTVYKYIDYQFNLIYMYNDN